MNPHQSDKENFQLLFSKAENLLSYRPRSAQELERRLVQYAFKNKLVDAEIIVKKVLKTLQDNKLVDDLEFAKWWIKERVNFKPRGLRFIKRELLNKGINVEIVEQALENYSREEKDIFGVKREAVNDLFLARKIIEKKLKTFKKENFYEFREKMIRYLIRYGFSYEIAAKVLEELKEKSYD